VDKLAVSPPEEVQTIADSVTTLRNMSMRGCLSNLVLGVKPTSAWLFSAIEMVVSLGLASLVVVVAVRTEFSLHSIPGDPSSTP
jgi:hypothetical protein